jgi:hypothetical protein
MPTRAAGGQIEELPIRKASIWLFSNIPAIARMPFRLALNPGIPFVDRDFAADPDLHAPVIGMRAFLRAGLDVKISFARRTVSIWVPGGWYASSYLFLRRAARGFSTLPMPWSQ